MAGVDKQAQSTKQKMMIFNACKQRRSHRHHHHHHLHYRGGQLMHVGELSIRHRKLSPPFFLLLLLLSSSSCLGLNNLGFTNQPQLHQLSRVYITTQPKQVIFRQKESSHAQQRRHVGTFGQSLESTRSSSSSSSSSDATEQSASRVGDDFLNTAKADSTTTTTTATTRTLTLRNCLGRLTALTRPANVPAIILLHMLGIHLALESATTATTAYKMSTTTTTTSCISLLSFWNLVLRQPAMWLVLLSVVLVSSTSMVVNDYYDAKLGRDDASCSSKNESRPLASANAIPLPLVRLYVSDLYAILLLLVPFLPGVVTRFAVTCSAIITFLYTKHLKPKTWIKNIACAVIIAASPLTSGAAALNLSLVQGASSAAAATASTSSSLVFSSLLHAASLWRLVTMLFFGILAREMMMDCQDIAGDGATGVRTVPVVYGIPFTTRVALGLTTALSVMAVSVPWLNFQRFMVVTTATAVTSSTSALSLVSSIFTTSPGRRFLLASIGSVWQLGRSWQVCDTRGRDGHLIDRFVSEGMMALVFLLASFVA